MTSLFRNAWILLAVAIFTTACGGGEGANDNDKRAKLNKLKEEQAKIATEIATLEKELGGGKIELKTRPVKTSTLNTTTFEHFVQVQGAVISEENVMVNARIPGIITKVLVKEGQEVKKGQILATQDTEVMRSSLTELETQLELATTLFERQKALWDEKIGSEVSYLNAKTQKEALEKRLKAMRVQINQAQLIAPISGVIDAVNIKEGEVANPGFGVIRIVNMNDVKVEANVSDAYLGSVKEGDKVKVRFPDLNNAMQNGSLSFVGKTVNAMSRTFLVNVAVADKANLRPNQIAVVNINDRSVPNAIVIQESIIQNTEQGALVYIAAKENGKLIARQRIVETGQSYNGMVEVTKGLQAGDELVTFGFGDLVDGTPIAIDAK